MMTVLMSGLDPQYSGAVPAAQVACCNADGATSGWVDSPDGFFGFSAIDPTLDGMFPYARLGAPLYAPSVHDDWSWFVGDSVSWTKGRHQFKFGGEYRHFLNNVQDGGLARGL